MGRWCQGYQSCNFYVKRDHSLSASNIDNVHVKQESENFFRAIQSPQKAKVEETITFSDAPLSRL